MTTIHLDQTAEQWLDLVRRAAAGEDVVLLEDGQPLVRLTSCGAASLEEDVHSLLVERLQQRGDDALLMDDAGLAVVAAEARRRVADGPA